MQTIRIPNWGIIHSLLLKDSLMQEILTYTLVAFAFFFLIKTFFFKKKKKDKCGGTNCDC